MDGVDGVDEGDEEEIVGGLVEGAGADGTSALPVPVRRASSDSARAKAARAVPNAEFGIRNAEWGFGESFDVEGSRVDDKSDGVEG